MTEIIRYLGVGFGIGFALAGLLAIYFMDRAWARKHPKSKGK